MLAQGTHRFGSDTGRMILRTYRTGLGSKAGHDLVIEVTEWRGTATLAAADSTAGATGTLDADVESFAVREGRGGVKPLTDGDRADIRNTIKEKVLHTRQHPRITFAARAVSGHAGALTIDGDLTIHGATRPISVRGSVTEAGGEHRLRAQAQVRQSDWGIKPYSAFLGALKLRDEVDIEVDAALVPGG